MSRTFSMFSIYLLHGPLGYLQRPWMKTITLPLKLFKQLQMDKWMVICQSVYVWKVGSSQYTKSKLWQKDIQRLLCWYFCVSLQTASGTHSKSYPFFCQSHNCIYNLCIWQSVFIRGVNTQICTYIIQQHTICWSIWGNCSNSKTSLNKQILKNVLKSRKRIHDKMSAD